MPHNFNGRFRNASGLGNIWAKTLEWWSETATFSICENLLQRANDENLLKNVITSDETWVYSYNIESKQRSSHWKSPTLPRPKKAWQVSLWVKAMLLVFF
jgi:hypothetical protein